MFSYLFSDWSIQNFGEILSKNFWIDQSEEREGKFKFQNWSNFGPKELEIGTRYLESNFSFVIHMSKRLFFEQTGQIWGGVKGPTPHPHHVRVDDDGDGVDGAVCVDLAVGCHRHHHLESHKLSFANNRPYLSSWPFLASGMYTMEPSSKIEFSLQTKIGTLVLLKWR